MPLPQGQNKFMYLEDRNTKHKLRNGNKKRFPPNKNEGLLKRQTLKCKNNSVQPYPSAQTDNKIEQKNHNAMKANFL